MDSNPGDAVIVRTLEDATETLDSGKLDPSGDHSQDLGRKYMEIGEHPRGRDSDSDSPLPPENYNQEDTEPLVLHDDKEEFSCKTSRCEDIAIDETAIDKKIPDIPSRAFSVKMKDGEDSDQNDGKRPKILHPDKTPSNGSLLLKPGSSANTTTGAVRDEFSDSGYSSGAVVTWRNRDSALKPEMEIEQPGADTDTVVNTRSLADVKQKHLRMSQRSEKPFLHTPLRTVSQGEKEKTKRSNNCMCPECLAMRRSLITELVAKDSLARPATVDNRATQLANTRAKRPKPDTSPPSNTLPQVTRASRQNECSGSETPEPLPPTNIRDHDNTASDRDIVPEIEIRGRDRAKRLHKEQVQQKIVISPEIESTKSPPESIARGIFIFQPAHARPLPLESQISNQTRPVSFYDGVRRGPLFAALPTWVEPQSPSRYPAAAEFPPPFYLPPSQPSYFPPVHAVPQPRPRVRQSTFDHSSAIPQSLFFGTSPVIEPSQPIYTAITPPPRPVSSPPPYGEWLFTEQNPSRDEDYYRMPPPPPLTRPGERPVIKHAKKPPTSHSIYKSPQLHFSAADTSPDKLERQRIIKESLSQHDRPNPPSLPSAVDLLVENPVSIYSTERDMARMKVETNTAKSRRRVSVHGQQYRGDFKASIEAVKAYQAFEASNPTVVHDMGSLVRKTNYTRDSKASSRQSGKSRTSRPTRSSTRGSSTTSSDTTRSSTSTSTNATSISGFSPPPRVRARRAIVNNYGAAGGNSILILEEDSVPAVKEAESQSNERRPAWRRLRQKVTIYMLWKGELGVSPPPELWSSKKPFSFLQDVQVSQSDKVKDVLERFSGQEWNWWPFNPRMASLAPDKIRIKWQCACGELRWIDASKNLARKCKELVEEEPLVDQKEAPMQSSRNATADSQSQSVVPGSFPSGQPNSIDNTLNANGPSIPASPCTKSETGAQKDLYVLFCLYQKDKIRHAQIEATKCRNDERFFEDLRREYRRMRGFWRYWLSPLQFDHCEFVKFTRFYVDELARVGRDLPHDLIYQYSPRPPGPHEDPPISPHEFRRRFYSNLCNPCSREEALERIPKRRKRFQVNLHVDGREDMWGLHVELRPCFLIIILWQILISAGGWGFMGWWLSRHSGDLQTAAVPVTLIITALMTLWLPISDSMKVSA